MARCRNFPILSIPAVVLVFATVSATQAPKTEVSLRSEDGDHIGVGQTYFYLGFQTAAAIDENGDGRVDHVRILYFTPSNTESSWTFGFSSAKTGRELTIGPYEDAMRTGQESEGRPGLEVFGNFRHCDGVTGRFNVFDAVYDYSVSPPRVVSFGVVFEQHCEGAKPALFGTLYFNSTVEPDLQKPTVTNVQLSKRRIVRKKDSSVMISWTSSDNVGLLKQDVSFASDGKTFSTVIAADLPVSAQSLTWTVPSTLKKTSQGVVKVTAKDTSGNVGEAIQKGAVTIK